jgi:hypothetical protein
MSRRLQLLAGVFVVCTAIAVTACSETLGVTEAGLESHRARWEAAGLTAYVYEYSKQCECGPETLRPARIEVLAGSVARVTFLDNAQTLESPPADAFPTIDDLFGRVDEAVRMDAASLVVTYDPTLGYPTLISVDYRRDIADDEFVIRASNLEAQ